MRALFFCIFIYIVIIMSSLTAMAQENMEKAILAGGCFWCIESDFEKLDGVAEAVSGYAGGDRPNPVYENYNKVTEEFQTPHIEVIEVTYDSEKLSYKDILDYFVRHIDPTDGEGQFCDRGPGYRPAIFVNNDEERKIAETVLAETQDIIGQDVNVEILPMAQFNAAEDYHQDYANKSPIRYKFYRWNCGRDQTIADIWGKDQPKQADFN
jgi:methionine-S-sulfoxide reductase